MVGCIFFSGILGNLGLTLQGRLAWGGGGSFYSFFFFELMFVSATVDLNMIPYDIGKVQHYAALPIAIA